MNRILKPIIASLTLASVASGATARNTPRNIANDVTQIGEFVTDGTSQPFDFRTDASETNNVAAFHVRRIPEPSAAFLGVFALSGFVLRRHR